MKLGLRRSGSATGGPTQVDQHTGINPETSISLGKAYGITTRFQEIESGINIALAPGYRVRDSF